MHLALFQNLLKYIKSLKNWTHFIVTVFCVAFDIPVYSKSKNTLYQNHHIATISNEENLNRKVIFYYHLPSSNVFSYNQQSFHTEGNVGRIKRTLNGNDINSSYTNVSDVKKENKRNGRSACCKQLTSTLNVVTSVLSPGSYCEFFRLLTVVQ